MGNVLSKFWSSQISFKRYRARTPKPVSPNIIMKCLLDVVAYSTFEPDLEIRLSQWP